MTGTGETTYIPIVCVCGGGGEFVKQCVVCCFFLHSLARPCVFFFLL